MQRKTNTNIERIIAKIDNDFNPDNSDWIPRVAAWCIDAMNMLNILRTKKTIVTLPVEGNIAYATSFTIDDNIKVYDTKGNKIKRADKEIDESDLSTGESASETSRSITPQTVDEIINENAAYAPTMIAETVQDKNYPPRYNVRVYNDNLGCTLKKRSYTIVDSNKIELNFETDKIKVEYNTIETYTSDAFNCELPVIPNNGLLIEAIAYYCMYKMLCRGYKHPIFNLHASQYGTNPYYEWIKLKDQVKRSVIIDSQGDVIDDGGLWQSSFFNFTFNPRK